MSAVRNYALVTAAYWAFTLTDGALRMIVLLHFHERGYTPVELALLFVFYELFGVITNLVGTNADGSPKYAKITNGTSSGVTYYGTVQITNAPVSPQYADKMRMVTVSLVWTNGNVPRNRKMQTLISANGLQDYIFE